MSKGKRLFLLRGDCVEAMAKMPADSIHSLVTDPPYGLGFMGKEFDTLGDGPAQQVWHLRWLTAAFRILKPGGYLLAFGGTRTYHRLACAAEDAGFEVRDQIQWIYGSGFPKSHNIEKAMKKKGYQEAGAWSGWGTTLKPAQEPILVARKPLSEKTIVANVLAHGTGAINVDACRVGVEKRTYKGSGVSQMRYTEGRAGLTDGRGRDMEFSVSGRWPANVVLQHLAGCVQEGTREEPGYTINRFTDGAKPFGGGAGHAYESSQTPPSLVPVWTCAPGCPVARLDEQSGVSKSTGGRIGNKDGGSIYGGGKGLAGAYSSGDPGFGDTGGASRFFYTPKASRKERELGCDRLSGEGRKNQHPTVKPVALMEYLLKLVTPKNGIALDPFVGSGTTLVAAAKLPIKAIGIEKDPKYAKIAKARKKHAERSK